MKTKTALLLVGAALLLAGCRYTGPSASVTAPKTAPTATPTVAKSTNINDINAELNATIDDGGQADLKQLEKDASGL